MKNLDFLSDSPKLFLFQKISNKTFFGGVLFLFYIIFMFILSLVYILDFLLNDNYEVESSIILNENNIINKTSKENPNISFHLELNRLNGGPADKRLKIFDENGKFIQRNTEYKKKVSEFVIGIFYECEGNYENCSIPEDIKYEGGIRFSMLYDSFKLDNQDNPPLKETKRSLNCLISLDLAVLTQLNWNVIKYKEQEGMFSRIKKFFYGLFKKDINNEYINGYINYEGSAYFGLKVYFINNKFYILIGEISIANKYNIEYTEYKRKRINSFWDFLAKIGSLFVTILSLFKFCFKYYSNNFDNYKTIENIYVNKINNIDKYKIIELKSKNVDKTSDNNKLSSLLIDENSKEKKKTNEININDIEEIINEQKTSKKLHFYNYFLNYLYCDCCIKSNKQEIIKICNEIITKYMSIESLLYNQLILENLLKDYKWNNPNLNNLQSNDFINKYEKLL